MKLWAIEPEKNWHELQSKRYLRAGNEFYENVEPPKGDGYYPYEWLKDQMKVRVYSPPDQGIWPIWCYYKWDGKPKIDLRTWRSFLPKGEVYVRIEFHCPDKIVLLSDYELWFYVLNHWYLPVSKTDGDKFEKEFPDAPSGAGERWSSYAQGYESAFHDKIVRSWNRIFQLDWEDEYFTVPIQQKSIIGWVWEIRYKWVKSHKLFIGNDKIS